MNCPNCGEPEIGVTVKTPDGICPCGFKPIDDAPYRQVSPEPTRQPSETHSHNEVTNAE